MQVTVLGKSPSWQDAAGACSGYLVVQDDFTLLMDCGNGTFAKLRTVLDYTAVDAVVISHMHADHFLDLVPFSYGLANARRRAGGELARRPLHVPAGGADALRTISGCWGSPELFDEVFTIHEYTAQDTLTLGPLGVRFCEVPHYIQAFAIELSAGSGRFTFGADCGPNPELIAFAADTDVLMVEATLTEPDTGELRGHMTPHEAGAHGAAAGARRLVLTHYSDEVDPDWARREAAASYGGAVELAHEGAVYAV